MSRHYHQIGDHVRLNKGWTLMTVIGYDGNEVIAQYGPDPSPESFDRPDLALSTYTRPHWGFTPWDKEPVKVTSKMAKTFQTKEKNSRRGVLLSKSSNGAFVLELEDGSVEAFLEDDIYEVVPFTFSVKSVSSNYPVSSNYRIHYLLESGNVEVGNLLLSDSGNLYLVMEVDTRSARPKGTFQGVRLKTEAL